LTPSKNEKPMDANAKRGELPVPIADGLVARVPFPIPEEDFDLLIETLKLWKRKLIGKPSQPPVTQESK
jgi:hypothetical protein